MRWSRKMRRKPSKKNTVTPNTRPACGLKKFTVEFGSRKVSDDSRR